MHRCKSCTKLSTTAMKYYIKEIENSEKWYKASVTAMNIPSPQFDIKVWYIVCEHIIIEEIVLCVTIQYKSRFFGEHMLHRISKQSVKNDLFECDTIFLVVWTDNLK